jgi:TRAP-type C4-dicarboxylate transport system permease small subunit
MRILKKNLDRLCNAGLIIGATCLVIMMLLTVSSVVTRSFGHVISGSFELIQLLILIAVGFALVFTALQHSHIVAGILMSKYPPKIRLIIDCFNSVLCVVTSALIFYTGFDMMIEKWVKEKTEILLVPYLPFRVIWVFCLLLLFLIFLVDLIENAKRIRK